MDIISDILLASGAIGAGFYCLILARRLRRFTDLEKGVGGAVAVLSAQVDDLKKTLVVAQKSAAATAGSLGETTRRGEEAAKRLELMLASLHDLPIAAPEAPKPAATARSPYFTRQAETGRAA